MAPSNRNSTEDTSGNQRPAQNQRTLLPRPPPPPHGLPLPSQPPSHPPPRPQPTASQAHKQSAINHIHDGEAGYRDNRQLQHTYHQAALNGEFQQRVRDMAKLYQGEGARMKQNYEVDIAASRAKEVKLVSEVETDFTKDPAAARVKWASLGGNVNQGTEGGDRAVAGKKRAAEMAPHGLPYPRRQKATLAEEVPEADRIMKVESE